MDQIKNKWFKVTVMIVVIILWLTVTTNTAFLWTIFLLWLAFGLDSRILGGVAIAFLVIIPFALHFGAEARAEQLAVYVYFLLVMVVTLQIIEFWHDKKE